VSAACPSEAFSPSEPEAIAAMAAKVGLPQGSRWYTYVGGFNPHKNVDAIVRAHARVVSGAEAPPHLLLVGTIDGDVFHGDQGRIRAEIEQQGTGELVHWTGFLTDADLRHLHAGAIANVLPSQLEGLGLPAVEAAACGTPVVATTTSPLPELLEGGGFFVDPGDEQALFDGMRRLFEDAELQRELGAVALRRAVEITWHRSALAALDALREAAA
jgi:alpha-1,3-rhamnosyl/mannosyltransferase